MNVAVAATAILLSVADPQGDAFGDGAYQLPRTVDANTLDLRSFSAINQNGLLELRVGMGAIKNAQRAPLGFTGPIIEIFLTDAPGGNSTLGETGFSTSSKDQGWRHKISLSGWSAKLEGEGVTRSPTVSVDGTEIVIETGLPSRDYVYWAMSGLYDPMHATGWLQPKSNAAALVLSSALPEAPPALDVLSNESQVGFYGSRLVPAIGKLPDRRGWLLVSGGLGLVFSLLGLLMRPRRHGF